MWQPPSPIRHASERWHDGCWGNGPEDLSTLSKLVDAILVNWNKPPTYYLQEFLSSAISLGRVAYTKLLLEKGAKLGQEDNCHIFLPMHQAAARGHVEVVNVLLEKGADVDTASWYSEYPLSPFSVVTSLSGKTPLCFAAAYGQVDAINLLIAAGTDMDALDKDGSTFLNLFIEGSFHKPMDPTMSAQGIQHVPFALQFITKGASPLITEEGDRHKDTLLDKVLRGDQREISSDVMCAAVGEGYHNFSPLVKEGVQSRIPSWDSSQKSIVEKSMRSDAWRRRNYAVIRWVIV